MSARGHMDYHSKWIKWMDHNLGCMVRGTGYGYGTGTVRYGTVRKFGTVDTTVQANLPGNHPNHCLRHAMGARMRLGTRIQPPAPAAPPHDAPQCQPSSPPPMQACTMRHAHT